MKIAIACHPTFGGSGVVASELGMELARRGHEVHFVSYQPPVRVNHLDERVHVHEVEVTSYPLFRYPPYALALATKLMEVVRTQGVRLLHAHYAIPHSISAILARQMCADCGVQVITTLHGTDITLVGSDHSFAEVTRYAIQESQAVTAVSEFLAAATRERFDVDRRIHVVPNFVDPERYSPAHRREALRRRYARDDEALFIHVSNFRPVKRPLDVIAIFDLVARQQPAKLLLIGTGPEAAAVEEQVAARGLKDRVIFAGAMLDVSEVLACGDIFLLPSDAESFGLAALEAMACGVPVVGTRAGGLPEVVEDGQSGILEAVGDVETMAARTIRLLASPAALQHARRAARQRAIEEFPVDRVVARYEDVYRSVVEGSD